jgi:hypothetical protein
MSKQNFWRRCSTCKNEIDFSRTYWVCNVSTCNRKRTDLVFCEVSCWDAHVPLLRHRESWAEERRSPSAATWEQQQAAAARGEGAGQKKDRKPATQSGPASAGAPTVIRRPRAERESRETPAQTSGGDGEILIVASKLKAYVRERSGFKISDRVMERLSDEVRRMCDAAIERARREEQKTVMARDFE